MRDVSLWSAIRDQAQAWSATPVFGRFTKQLPRNSDQRTTGIPGVLQELEAGGAEISARPLRLGSSIPRMLDVVPGINLRQVGPAWTSWLDTAQKVESAHRMTIAWLRARLPGYPILPAPQLAAGTPLTTLEFTSRLIWTPDERRRGLQFQPAPINDGGLLEASSSQRRDLGDTARSMAAAFESSEEWQLLRTATDALDDAARETLAKTKASLRRKLRAASVDLHEPTLALPRAEYRSAVLAEEIAAMQGSARAYADAFDKADRLIETLSSDIFGQLAAYGEPDTCARPRDLDIEPGSPTTIRFTWPEDTWPEIGAIVWLDDPLIADAVHVTALHSQFNQSGGLTQQVSAAVLTGTTITWHRPLQ